MTSDMTPAQNAAAMHGLATNPGVADDARLSCALQALAFYVQEREERDTPKFTVIGVNEKAPQIWKDLAEAVVLLSKGAISSGPFHCEHDTLTVTADPHKFTNEELSRLYQLGFFVSNHEESNEGSAANCTRQYCDAVFTSFRFGSA